MLSECDQEALVHAACQLIDTSLDPNSLFNEACSLSKKLKLERQNGDVESVPALEERQAIERFLSVTCNDCVPSTGDKDVLLTTPNLARQIVKLSKEVSLGHKPLLERGARESLAVCIEMIKLSLNKSKLNKEMFASFLFKYDLPLEVIWTLHKISAIDLNTYVTSKFKQEKTHKVKLHESLVALCTGSQETQPLRQEILSDFTAYLLNRSFSDQKTSAGQFARQTLDAVLQDVLNLTVPTEEESLALPSDFLMMKATLEAHIVKKFAVHSLSLILSYNADKSVEDWMKSSVDWTSLKITCALRLMIKQYFLPLSYQDVSIILRNVLEHEFINGLHIYAYLSALYTYFPEAATGMKEHTQSQISNALDMSSAEEMFMPFFLARLSSSLGPHCFPSYADWFQATFCCPSSKTLSRSGYNLLIKFLTSLVPWETPERLKVYIFHRPSRPPKCKEQFEDFVVLAKTRLVDLGVSLESMNSMYGDSHSSTDNANSGHQTKKITTTDSIEQDVLRAVASFTESRKIPAVLIQASIFQRPYFMGKFLPALLKARVLPDRPDDRMLLIAEMNKSGKIPASVHSQYLQACEREKQALLEGVFDVDDEEEMQELTLPLMDQLDKRLEKFVLAALDGTIESDAVLIGCLDAVIEKVSSLLMEAVPGTPEQKAKISCDSVAVDLSKLQNVASDSVSKVTGLLSNHLSSLVTKWKKQMEREKQNQTTALPIAIISPVVKLWKALLQRCPELRTSVYSTVLIALNPKKKGDVEISSPGLPLLCLSLATLPYSLTVRIDSGRADEVTSFVQTLLHNLDILNGREEVLRFCLEYVQAACVWLTSLNQRLEREDVVELDGSDVTEVNLMPGGLVKKMHLMCQRHGLTHSQGSNKPVSTSSLDKLTDLAASMFGDKLWKQMHKKHELSLVEWIELEWSVDTLTDVLPDSERLAYLWKTSGFYLQHSHSLSSFCRTMILTMARLCNHQAGAEPAKEESAPKVACFLQLLQKLLMKLPAAEDDESIWLLDILQSSEETNHLIRFALKLPAHLMFCNSPQKDDFGSAHISSALAFTEYLIKSPQNLGAYLSLEATMYILQAIEEVADANQPLATSALEPLVAHPSVFISLLVHKPVLTSLNFFESSTSSPPSSSSLLPSSKWQEKVNMAELWANGICGNLSPLYSTTDSHGLDHWQMAAALFSFVLLRKFSVSPSKLKLHLNVYVHLLEMLATHLTLNAAWTDVENPKNQSPAQIFVEVVQCHPSVLKTLLGLNESQTTVLPTLSSQLGLDAEPWMMPLRNLFILRLARNVPAYVVMKCPDNVILPVVSAYRRILAQAEENETCQYEGFQTDLSAWIKSLVDLATPEHLAIIPEFSSTSPQHADILLFRYIQEKKRTRRKF